MELKRKKQLKDLTIEELRKIEPKLNLDVFKVFDLKNSVNSKKSYEQLRTIGQVLSITKRTTRAKEQFIICELGLLDNSMELVVWPDKMEASQYLWETGTYLELDVKTNLRNGSVNMIFEKGKKYIA